ncbi:MAG TPA: SIMPL domain-containing protein [Chitinophagaceae bacterium]|nr:SIMPL domain-containing protein [Chitinophagales bacterium]HMZ45977.1 SIMPL domain-containing protein [Chitinophagaceae bacterium]HMW13878.1 SIMPL domain-containing protein [Chitinophagales bacterium]HMX61362.1 SIMPL domain-containing protein [Chitinophagales bacterium]HMY24267.1 SIMPL domain-containing protein [Chitinophagales bacterium]
MKLLISAISLLLTLHVQAQFTSTNGSNEKYIEVKTTDTLMVNPDAISLLIALGEKKEKNYYFDDDQTDAEKEEEARKEKNDAIQKKKQIEEILKKNNVSAFKFHDKKEDKDLFTKEFNLYENTYEVELKTDAQVEKIKKEMIVLKDVSTKVANSKLNDKEKYELILIDKVMKKAEREASAIAKTMNVTLDKALNVSNQSVNDIYSSMFNSPESMGGMGALFSMMGNMFKGATQQNTQVVVSKTLIVRFAIK